MTGSSRKGLKRHGMCSYELSAGDFGYIIRRLGRRRWSVRRKDQPDFGYAFFSVLFHSLCDARRWAWEQLYPGKPKPRIRRNRAFKSDPRAVLLAARLIADDRKRNVPE